MALSTWHAVPISQSRAPHAHLIVVGVTPVVSLQDEILLHVCESKLQYIPVVSAAKQLVWPQAHGKEFAEEPSVTAQDGYLVHVLMEA